MAISRNIKEIKLNKLFTGVKKTVVESRFKRDEFFQISEGEVIYQSGDEADCLYLLISGKVKIKYPSHHYISNKSPKDFFGEKELFDDTRRNSSAVANSDCLIYEISADVLKKLIDKEDLIGKNIDQFGEVVLPEIDQTVQGGISLSSSDKPISFNATYAGDEKIDNQSDADVMNESISQTVENLIEEQLIAPSSDFDIEDEDIVIEDIDKSEIKLDIASDIDEEEKREEVDYSQTKDLRLNQAELKEIFDALLIAHNQLTVYDSIQSILFAVKKLLSSTAGEIYIVNESAGDMMKYIDDNGKLKGKHFKSSEGLTGTCLLQRKTLNFDEPAEDSRFVSEIDQPGEAGLKKILYIPLLSKSNLFIGVLQLARLEPGYSDIEVGKLELISNQLSAAIERSKRFEQLLHEERQIGNRSIYNFLEDNISIPTDIINSYSAILKNEESGLKGKDILPLLQLQVKLLRDIIKTTFDYNKPDLELDLKKSNLNKFIQSTSILLSEYCEARNINLFIKTGQTAIVNFDPGRLFMAIYQLIKNACDASTKHSDIFIKVEADAGAANIIILDEGAGIEESLKTNLFNPVFDVTKGRNRFGLTIVKKIVELHEGKIIFTSVENEGSIFTISLPIIETENLPSLLDHFEPAFQLDESEMDFSEYLSEENQGDEENTKL